MTVELALSGSTVVRQLELPRVGTEPHRVEVVGPLVGDVVLDQFLGEDAADEQIVVIGFERSERRFQ